MGMLADHLGNRHQHLGPNLVALKKSAGNALTFDLPRLLTGIPMAFFPQGGEIPHAISTGIHVCYWALPCGDRFADGCMGCGQPGDHSRKRFPSEDLSFPRLRHPVDREVNLP